MTKRGAAAVSAPRHERKGERFAPRLLIAVIASIVGYLVSVFLPPSLLRDEARSVWYSLGFGPSKAERAVDALYDEERQDSKGIWSGSPALGPFSKTFLIKHWDQYNDEKVHRFGAVPAGQRVGFGQLWYDRTFNGKPVHLVGYVSDRPSLFSLPSGNQGTFRSFEIGVVGQSARVWCLTTLPPNQKLHYGERIAIRGLPFAWGAMPLDRGRERLETMLVCPGVRKLST